MAAVYTLEQIENALAQSSDADIIDTIETCFIQLSKGRAQLAPVVHLGPFDPSGRLTNDACIKSGSIQDEQHFVVKVATGGFSDNVALGLPTADGLMAVLSQRTGLLEGILMDRGYLTDLRTAAAGAVAARYLAPMDVEHIGIVGTGRQALMQTRFLASVTSCRSVLVWGRTEAHAKKTCADIEALGLGFTARICASLSELANKSRLIVTTTSASTPLLFREDVQPGTHITAMGADGLGKQELDPDICARANLCVADSRAQCVSFGELSHACKASTLQESNVIELGDLIMTERQQTGTYSRQDVGDSRITVFDSTGVGVQDVAIASMTLRLLKSLVSGRDNRARL